MNESTDKSLTTRRQFIKTTGGGIVAASALAGVTLPHVHAADSQSLNVALIGCGGRGTGAAANALSVTGGNIKLTAMADVYQDRLDGSYQTLMKQKVSENVDVPPDHQFIGFDGYQKAMDTLKPGDIAIFTTPLAFRWVHFEYAIKKRLNVFMEKPLTADGPSSRKMMKLAEEASARNLKVGVGLMSRHSRPLQELHQRIQDGEIGDLILSRGYRMHGPVGSAFSTKWPGEPSELMWQIQRFHSFLWASGGCYSDFYIHHIDQLCWMKNAYPVKAQGVGGRHYRGDNVDQNFDTYAVEYTFPDGTKMYMDGRCIPGCASIYNSYVHGTKGSAIVSKNGDCGQPSAIFKGQSPDRADMTWSSEAPPGEGDPYLNEWNDLVKAIRNDTPYNEVPYGVQSSVATSLGRAAAHTGQELTFDDFLNSDHEYAPGIENFTKDSPAPVQAGSDGTYPVPVPGILKDREYKS